MSKVSFIGLGVMGGPLSRHLALAGHELTVFNRTRSKAESWAQRNAAEHGFTARVVGSPAEAADGADAVITCVGNDDDLSDVALAPDGIFSTLKKGGLFIDHTTVSAKIARQLSVEAKSRGTHFVDAPVTGGQAGAENGTLSIMCGGTEAALEAARPILAAYSSRVVHVGRAGSGQSAKMANQVCIAGVLAGLSEALRFAQTAGLDTDKVFEAISGGAAQSWQMDNRWHTMNRDEFSFGFAVDWMRKDLGLAIDEARALGTALPMTALIDQFFCDIQEMGYGREDTSALIRRLPRKGSAK